MSEHEEHGKEESHESKGTSLGLDAVTLIVVAVIGRIILEPFPSIEPIIPIAVYAGMRYGMNTGIIVGLLSYPLSNLMMSGGIFGLWTFLQAAGGAIAGGVASTVKLTKNNLMVYSIVGTLLFEFALNIPDGLLVVWPFSFTHIISNIIIAAIIGELLLKE